LLNTSIAHFGFVKTIINIEYNQLTWSVLATQDNYYVVDVKAFSSIRSSFVLGVLFGFIGNTTAESYMANMVA